MLKYTSMRTLRKGLLTLGMAALVYAMPAAAQKKEAKLG